MSLVLHWKLNDNSPAPFVVDYSGNNLNGSTVPFLSTNLRATMGPPGYAMNFNGVDEGVEIADNARLDFGATDDFSVCGWVKLGTTSTTLFRKANDPGGGLDGYWLTYDPISERMFFITWENGVTARAFKDGLVQFGTPAWRHIVGVRYANAKDSLELWMDGKLLNVNDSAPGANRDLRNTGSFQLGVAGSANGDIADVKVFDHALSGVEVVGLYAEFAQADRQRGFRGS